MLNKNTATQLGVAINLWIYIGEIPGSNPMEYNYPAV
jgi:hypothetical protein